MSSATNNLMGKLLSKRLRSARSSAGGTDIAGRHAGCGDHEAVSLQPQHSDAVVSVASVQPGLCLSGSKDKSVVVFDYGRRKPEQRWTGHTSAITKVCYGAASDCVFSASRDTTLKMWRLGIGECQKEYVGHSMVVTAVDVSADNLQLCSGSRDNSVKLWDVETATCIKTNTIPQNLVTDVKFVPSSALVVQTGEDKEVRLFDHRLLQPVFSFTKKQYIQMCCDVSHDGNYIATCSNGFSGNGCEASVWDMRARTLQREYRGHTEAVEACMFLPGVGSNLLLATASRDQRVKVWDQQTGVCECEHLFDGTGPLTSLAAYQDGTVLIGSFNNRVRVLKLCDGSLAEVTSY